MKYSGIDRIDSKGGYTANNVRPCCRTCNTLKNDATEAEFVLKLLRMRDRALQIATELHLTTNHLELPKAKEG